MDGGCLRAHLVDLVRLGQNPSHARSFIQSFRDALGRLLHTPPDLFHLSSRPPSSSSPALAHLHPRCRGGCPRDWEELAAAECCRRHTAPRASALPRPPSAAQLCPSAQPRGPATSRCLRARHPSALSSGDFVSRGLSRGVSILSFSIPLLSCPGCSHSVPRPVAHRLHYDHRCLTRRASRSPAHLVLRGVCTTPAPEPWIVYVSPAVAKCPGIPHLRARSPFQPQIWPSQSSPEEAPAGPLRRHPWASARPQQTQSSRSPPPSRPIIPFLMQHHDTRNDDAKMARCQSDADADADADSPCFHLNHCPASHTRVLDLPPPADSLPRPATRVSISIRAHS